MQELCDLLLDLMLPGKSGEDVIKGLRRIDMTPIIVLSAKCETHDRVELLRSGADDHITKPFDIDEVLLRIQAVLRRTTQQERNELIFKAYTL